MIFISLLRKQVRFFERKIRKRKDKVIDGYHKKDSIRDVAIEDEFMDDEHYEVIRHKKFEAILVMWMLQLMRWNGWVICFLYLRILKQADRLWCINEMKKLMA